MEQIIQNILKNLKDREGLLNLFREKLGFKSPAVFVIPFDIDRENAKEAETIAEFGPVKIFYLCIQSSFDESFASERQIRKIEREIITKISAGIRRQNIFIFSDSSKEYWDFVYPIDYGRRLILKRFIIRPDNRDKLRTPATQLASLLIKSGEEDKLYKKLEEAFSVEAVSERFFKDYEEVFNLVKDSLSKQSSDRKRIHRFTHQLLNRLMFLYFVQRRGVFEGNKNFLAHFWNTYRNNFEGKNEFYDKWLKILFFEALNGKFPPPHFDYDYFRISEELDFNRILRSAPYLNGGLFKEDPEIDSLDALNIKLADDLFVKIFDFLESYNFTIRENTPLDEDLEIDPEMLGNIYEAMVNVTEVTSEDERHKAGIFYTPRTEIEFMLRQSLVEFLFNKTKIDKLKLYQFIFFELEKQKVPKFSQEDAKKLYDILDNITIVDPACGSGHYLVVAVQMIFDLKKELWLQLGNSEKSFRGFKEKLKIVETSIFGVDVKRWAAEIARLRLWLDLLVEATDEQLKPGGEALLPNLAFKVRVGDSLVQEIGGIFFRAKEIKGIPPSLLPLKKQLVEAKRGYFYGRRVSEPQVKSKEIQFFKALLDEKNKELKEQIYRLEAPLREGFRRQLQLTTISKKEAEQLKLELSKKEQEKINQLKEEMAHLEKEKQKISMRSEFAFWPIEFAEVLAGRDGEGGFDIVIANPPYVNYKRISDPFDSRKPSIYKRNLINQMLIDWNDKPGNLIKISGMSDLYVYFYLKGLQLLNPDGVMCYISSNFWLDVDYGATLQEVLLRRVPILAIYDNQAKRSFKHANINTVIVLLGAPKTKDWSDEVKENKVKLILFKKPFEEVVFTEVLWQIETIEKERISCEEFRSIQKGQWDLYIEGLEERKNEKERLSKEIGGVYAGNKWGQYLRAPDIYLDIITKHRNDLVPLKKIAEIKPGIKESGYKTYIETKTSLNKKGIGNFSKFIPILKKVDQHQQILISENDSFIVKRVTDFKKKSLPRAKILWLAMKGDRYITFNNPKNFYYSGNFFGINFRNEADIDIWLAVLNSSLTILVAEVFGRRGFGGGATILVKTDLEKLLVLNIEKLRAQQRARIKLILNKIKKRKMCSIFQELCLDSLKPIREQEPKPLPDRKALDDIVFDALGLTKEERKEVYWAVCELVKNRLEKAKSL